VVGVVPDMVMIEVPAGVKRGKVRVKIGDALIVTSADMLNISE